jgi:hypothetical protein
VHGAALVQVRVRAPATGGTARIIAALALGPKRG